MVYRHENYGFLEKCPKCPTPRVIRNKMTKTGHSRKVMKSHKYVGFVGLLRVLE